MSQETPLIPSPREVRDRLAQHIREGRLLRALYRLAIRASEQSREAIDGPGAREGAEGGRR